jgi:hypothetical protein
LRAPESKSSRMLGSKASLAYLAVLALTNSLVHLMFKCEGFAAITMYFKLLALLAVEIAQTIGAEAVWVVLGVDFGALGMVLFLLVGAEAIIVDISRSLLQRLARFAPK